MNKELLKTAINYCCKYYPYYREPLRKRSPCHVLFWVGKRNRKTYFSLGGAILLVSDYTPVFRENICIGFTNPKEEFRFIGIKDKKRPEEIIDGVLLCEIAELLEVDMLEAIEIIDWFRWPKNIHQHMKGGLEMLRYSASMKDKKGQKQKSHRFCISSETNQIHP